MKYQKVQPYRVYETWSYQTEIARGRAIRTEYVDLVDGLLTMKHGFCFEPSGPTIHTKSVMQGCCAHDAIYWLIKNGYLAAMWKDAGDELMRQIHLEDKVMKFRANYFYEAVSNFGDSSVDPRNRAKILTAP